MKFTICNEIFQDWSLPKTFEFARAVGYEAVEIAPFTLRQWVTDISAAERTEIRKQAEHAQISISGIHWVLAQTVGLHVTSPDPAVRMRTADYLRHLVDFSADLGGKFLIFGSPKQRELLPGIRLVDAWPWAREVLRIAGARAEERGITICIEPLALTETNFLVTATEAHAMAVAVDSPAVKILLDVKAMCGEVKPIPQIIAEMNGAFHYFHANDRNLKGPGFGDVDYVPIVKALREASYDGHVSVEVFKFEEGPEVIARQSREYLRKVFDE